MSSSCKKSGAEGRHSPACSSPPAGSKMCQRIPAYLHTGQEQTLKMSDGRTYRHHLPAEAVTRGNVAGGTPSPSHLTCDACPSAKAAAQSDSHGTAQGAGKLLCSRCSTDRTGCYFTRLIGGEITCKIFS